MAFLPHPLGNSREFDSIPVGIPNYWAVNSNKSEAEIEAGQALFGLHGDDRARRAIYRRGVPSDTGVSEHGHSNTRPTGTIDRRLLTTGKTIPWVWFMAPTGWLDSPTSPVMTALQIYYENGNREEFFTTIMEQLVELAN